MPGPDQTVSQQIAKPVGKVFLFGSRRSGKTSLPERIINNKFSSNTSETLGLEEFNIDFDESTLQIRECNAFFYEILYRLNLINNAIALIIIIDMTASESLEVAKDIRSNLGVRAPNIPIILVGTKSESPDQKLTEEQIRAFAEEYNLVHFIVDAKENKNCRAPFEHIAELVKTKYAETEKEALTTVTAKNNSKNFKINNDIIRQTVSALVIFVVAFFSIGLSLLALTLFAAFQLYKYMTKTNEEKTTPISKEKATAEVPVIPHQQTDKTEQHANYGSFYSSSPKDIQQPSSKQSTHPSPTPGAS